jgi:hypothetical protein
VRAEQTSVLWEIALQIMCIQMHKMGWRPWRRA